jgi:aerobic-type carbon monoxide dehydrogenase small subunit (CoxS/CutS family)
MTDPLRLKLTVNGRETAVDAAPEESLVFVIRERLGLTGTKISCDVQVCGACTVLLDDLPVSACTLLAYEADGRSLTTVEGLAADATALSPIQKAFLDQNAFQCGFCTSGMLLAAESYLRTGADLEGGDALLEHLGGNICRCTGYIPIVAAVIQAGSS